MSRSPLPAENIERQEQMGELSPRFQHVFSVLAHRLSGAQTPKHAALAILDSANELFGWDACFLNLYPDGPERPRPVIHLDTINGSRQEVTPEREQIKLSATARRVLMEGAKLLLSRNADFPEDLSLGFFGDTSRPSASLMFVPIRKGDRNLGILSIQSYLPDAYTKGDLEALNILADYCSGAIERILAEIRLRKQEELAKTFADLGRDLAAAPDSMQAASIILNTADRLFGWDACFLNLYDAQNDSLHDLITIDTFGGERIRTEPAYQENMPGSMSREVLREGAKLILRNSGTGGEVEKLTPFGNKERRSLSLMLAPMRTGKETVGILSIQSYAAEAYDETNLATLQSLADHCAGALLRTIAEENLRQANERLEARVEERTRELANSETIYRTAIETARGVPYRLRHGEEKYEFMGEGIRNLLGLTEDVSRSEINRLVRSTEILEPDAPQDPELYRRSFETGELEHYRVDQLMAAGEDKEKWISDSSVLIRDENGAPVGSLGILQDITLRKRAEEEERLTRERQVRELQEENLLLRRHILSRDLEHPEAFGQMLTTSKAMNLLFLYVESIAPSRQPVLVTGETGVGKELMARAIHATSGRSGQLITVNVAGLDDEVFSDTLFGHKQGAFTGAARLRKGLVESARRGTLFLDEIGDLALSSQIKLLRLLQEREYYALGEDHPRKSDARIIVATNHDLADLMRSGKFRKDLFYRLQTHHIHIPPLRERPEDIPLLAEHCVKLASENLKRKPPLITPELHLLLASYSFPGNIRELQSLIHDAISKQRGGTLPMEPISLRIKSREPLCEEQHISSAAEKQAELPTLRAAQEHLIREALRRTNNNQTAAAKLLGITQQALNRRLRDWARKAE